MAVNQQLTTTGNIGNCVKFERVRRITGYCVGTTDRWNNAKLKELEDRVKHGLGGGKAKC